MQSSVTIYGNVVTDVTLRQTPHSVVANFRVAITDGYFDKRQQAWVDRPPVYIGVSAWRSLAENVAASLVNGQPVVVIGKLRQREYEKDGRRVVLHEIEAERVGHDLTRGTASFTRAKRGPQTSDLALPDQPIRSFEGGHPTDVLPGELDPGWTVPGLMGLPAAGPDPTTAPLSGSAEPRPAVTGESAA
jgi:single-strand DNA-binding protein